MQLLTASSLRLFKGCRKKYYWRYICQIVPMVDDTSGAQTLGTLVHAGLEAMVLRKQLPMAPLPNTHPQHAAKARAMLHAYSSRWPSFPEGSRPEVMFKSVLRNPATGAPSRSFYVAGKVDVMLNNAELMEHKTASVIDAAYIQRFPLDSQILIYATYAAKGIERVWYDVLKIPRVAWKSGETAEEFAVRYTEACSKNKSGKSAITQELPDTFDGYYGRCLEAMQAPDSFLRQEVMVTEQDKTNTAYEVWELSQQILAAQRDEKEFYKNDGYCDAYHHTCPYLNLCTARHPDQLIEVAYEHKPLHTELEGIEDVEVTN